MSQARPAETAETEATSIRGLLRTLADALKETTYADALRDEDASTVAIVRRDSLRACSGLLAKPPPVLLPCTTNTDALYLYDMQHDGRDPVRQGEFEFNTKDFCVFGGCILDQGTYPTAASLLWSEDSNVLLVHVSDADVAGMELAMYDAAFCDDTSANKTERCEAAVASRSVGARDNELFWFDESPYHVRCSGVAPFLSLRHPRNAHEASLVRRELSRMLWKVAACEIPTPKDDEACGIGAVMQAKGLPNAATLAASRDVSPLQVGRDCDALQTRACLTHIATAMLHAKFCNAFPSRADVSEAACDQVVLRCRAAEKRAAAAEEAHLRRVHASEPTGPSLNVVGSGSFGVIRRGLGSRRFSFVSVVDADACSDTRMLLKTVAAAVFEPDDAELVAATASAHIAEGMCIRDALHTLSMSSEDHRAIVIATRDSCGRYTEFSMASKDTNLSGMSLDGVRRALVSPWVTVLVVEDSTVYRLVVHEPDFVQASAASLRCAWVRMQARHSVRQTRTDSRFADAMCALQKVQEQSARLLAKLDEHCALLQSLPTPDERQQRAGKSAESLKRSLASSETDSRRIADRRK